MDILVAILLGIVEGVTEFLPISSTGHLIISEKLLGFNDVQDMFTVVVQLGAILAVIWFYWRDLWSKVVGLFKGDTEALKFWKILVIASIPAGIVGLALESSMEDFTKPLVIAISLIVGGIILWLVDNKPVPKTTEKPDLRPISSKQALLVGLGQSVAIVPGVSRSGATIVTGLMSGLNRSTATAFSFYLSIPVLVLASVFKLYKHGDQLSQISGGGAALLAGMAAAFITALLTIGWLLRYVSRHNFRPFAYYRIAVGLLILILLGVNVL